MNAMGENAMKQIKRAAALFLLPILMLGAAGVTNAPSLPTGVVTGIEEGEEVRVSSRIWELLFGTDAVPAASAANGEVRLVVGGDVFGARIYQGFVSVACDLPEVGLSARDIIESVDGVDVPALRDVRGVIELGSGRQVLSVRRGDERLRIELSNEEARGILPSLSDGSAGIGTVTYVDPADMSFGGLGHGICDDAGAAIATREGVVTGVIIGGIKRGEHGHPGELSGLLTDRVAGRITANTVCGVFGVMDKGVDKSAAIPIAHRTEVHTGAATIICTVKNGKRAEYAVELYDLHPTETGTKCFKIRVTDKALLALTGGIVRGMSGSPIIQDGRLVGAVTHVMVADPTEGYGIFIENMLNASNARNELPKAA